MMPSFVSCISGAWIGQLLRALDAGLGGQVRHAREGLDVLRPAIGIAAVVERVDAHEDVTGAQRLGIGQRERQEDRVARRHVRDRNAGAHLAVGAALRHLDVGRQRRAAEHAQIDLRDHVARHSGGLGDLARRIQLGHVPLPVREAQRIRNEALAPGDGQHRRRIQPATQQDNRVLAAHRLQSTADQSCRASSEALTE